MTPTRKLKQRFYFIAARYFRFFANLTLKRWNPRIIALTGSVGKTTMLHLLEYELKDKAHYSHDANSAFGIAFDLVGLRGITGSKLRWLYLLFAVPIKSLYYKHKEEFYIVEIDGERPYETEFLASWLKPEITLWISLGRSHAIQFEQQVKNGTFENLDQAITHEFAMLPQYTTKRIYIDAGVKMMKKAVSAVKRHHDLPAKIIECHKSELEKYSVYPDHTDFTIGKTTFHFSAPMPKEISIQLIMLKKLCSYLKIPLSYDFSSLYLPPGRNSYFKGINNLKLIDSSYNAHLISMESILAMAKAMKAPHKWLVIADMVEQGIIEGDEHTKLADAIALANPEKIILIGRRTKKYTLPRLKELGFSAYTTNDPRIALKYIKKNAKNSETIIFKGSQYLEWIIEKLLKNPDDAKYLPRREKAAIKRRQKRGLN